METVEAPARSRAAEAAARVRRARDRAFLARHPEAEDVGTIERIEAPTVQAFVERYERTSTPVVITGVVEKWPAWGKWSLDYLQEHCSEISVDQFRVICGDVEINTERGSRRDKTSGRACLEAMAEMSGPTPDGTYFATARESLPETLQNDLEIPAFCAHHSWIRSMIMASMPGTITSLHHDLPENLYAQLTGAKRWTLYPPRPVSAMYRHPPYSKCPNHSRVDPENPDYEAFPRFRAAKKYVVDLQAGEILFLPSRWWHHVRSLEPEPAISVINWWATGWVLPVAWSAATYKRLRKI